MDYPDSKDLHQGKFTDGDPIAGIPPSLDSADHMNAVYDELINAIQGGGITPKVSDHFQLSSVLENIRQTVEELSALTEKVNAYTVPVGTIISFAGTTYPTGWLECNGSDILRADYADLFKVVGDTFDSDDDSTTFTLPDLRGEFIRGWDNSRGIDANRMFGSDQKATRVYFNNGSEDGYHNGVFDQDSKIGADYDGSIERLNFGSYASTTTDIIRGGVFAEGIRVRPRNIALMYCIKC